MFAALFTIYYFKIILKKIANRLNIIKASVFSIYELLRIIVIYKY